ncbi:arginase family protein [Mixta calida]|nr:arginase family protein [Mixta calida]
MPGAKSIGDILAQRSGTTPVAVGSPQPALNLGWRQELDAAMTDLKALQERFSAVFSAGAISVSAISRCAASLATLPALARFYPDVCLVWFDAHADLNTPSSTVSGFRGGLALSAPTGLWHSGLGCGLNFHQLVLVGQRDVDPFEAALIKQYAIPHLIPGPNLTERLQEAIAGRAVYVHLDCDVLEPGIVPVDYPVEGGLTLAELAACSKILAEHEYAGIEIAEFQNAWERDGEPVSPGPLIDALMPLLK